MLGADKPSSAVSQGYKRLVQGGIAFWTRPGMAADGSVRWRGDSAAGEMRARGGAGAEAAPRPLVFLHGVGWGLVSLRHPLRCLHGGCKSRERMRLLLARLPAYQPAGLQLCVLLHRIGISTRPVDLPQHVVSLVRVGLERKVCPADLTADGFLQRPQRRDLPKLHSIGAVTSADQSSSSYILQGWQAMPSAGYCDGICRRRLIFCADLGIDYQRYVAALAWLSLLALVLLHVT